jgi:hypothetical protein
MNRSFVRAIILGLSVLLLIGEVQASGEDPHKGGFSKSNLHGSYVESFHGWVSGGDGAVTGTSLGPENGVGLLIADGNGNYTGTETANILYNSNGNPTSPSACGGSSSSGIDAICAYNLTGTYSVNSDGTGTTTATVTPVTGSDCRCGPSLGFTASSSFVMQSSESLTFVGTDLDATVIGQAIRQAAPAHSD